jgi:sigma-B regulation protein RsbU (phosphoserine phosphatase)
VKPGQIIVLGTDGVWEAMNAKEEQFGKERLKEIVRTWSHGTAAEITDAVRRALDAFRGTQHQRDDVTLVVIKVMPVKS